MQRGFNNSVELLVLYARYLFSRKKWKTWKFLVSFFSEKIRKFLWNFINLSFDNFIDSYIVDRQQAKWSICLCLKYIMNIYFYICFYIQYPNKYWIWEMFFIIIFSNKKWKFYVVVKDAFLTKIIQIFLHTFTNLKRDSIYFSFIRVQNAIKYI